MKLHCQESLQLRGVVFSCILQWGGDEDCALFFFSRVAIRLPGKVKTQAICSLVRQITGWAHCLDKVSVSVQQSGRTLG